MFGMITMDRLQLATAIANHFFHSSYIWGNTWQTSTRSDPYVRDQPCYPYFTALNMISVNHKVGA